VKKKPEETAEDKAIGKVVAAKLREQIRPAATGCPEIETLAAFYDRALSDAERAVCEEHLMTCPRCQEYLAELARLSEIDEPTVLLEEETPAAHAPTSPAWYFRLAYVAPLLVVLIGVGIWYREDVRRFTERRPVTAMKGPEPALAPQPVTPTLDRAAAEPASAKKVEREGLAQKAAPARVPSSALSKDEARGAAPAITISGLRDKSAEAGEPGKMATPAERAQMAAAERADRVLQLSRERKETPLAGAAAPAAPPAAAPRAAEASADLATRPSSELGGVTIRGAAPTFAPKWRVGRRGIIQQADAAGGWRTVPSGVEDDLFDITFAGPQEGWAVGHEGTVLRTTDGGNTWSKVSSPTSEDLVRVSAQSGQQAQVISRRGKAFATTDGGRTWKSHSQ
jgi:hypothetical protein